jgi:DNA-binding CsgD family transcriptional regulator
MQQSYDLSIARNKLIKNYLIVIQIALFCFIMANIFIVVNFMSIALLTLLMLFFSFITFFDFYKKTSVQYICILLLIFIVCYFGLNRRLRYCNIFYVNIILSIIFIFDFKKDLFKICTLFLFIIVGAGLNIFTDWFHSGMLVTQKQYTALFTMAVILFFLFFVVDIIFIMRKKRMLDWYEYEYRYRKNGNEDQISGRDSVSIEDINLLKSELYEDYKGFLIHFQALFPIFYMKLKKLENASAADLEILSLIKLNYTTNEIAQITNSTIKSVESKKYRIRKKFNLSGTQDLYIWVDSL